MTVVLCPPIQPADLIRVRSIIAAHVTCRTCEAKRNPDRPIFEIFAVAISNARNWRLSARAGREPREHKPPGREYLHHQSSPRTKPPAIDSASTRLSTPAIPILLNHIASRIRHRSWSSRVSTRARALVNAVSFRQGCVKVLRWEIFKSGSPARPSSASRRWPRALIRRD